MTLPALAAEPERPTPGSAAHDLTHHFCCDPDRALCGAVVDGTPIVTAAEVVALCGATTWPEPPAPSASRERTAPAMKRFLLGLLCGAASGAVTYLVHPAPPWWWVIGLLVAIAIWTGELLLDAIDGD